MRAAIPRLPRPVPCTPADRPEARRLVVRLAEALHAAGVAAPELEEAVQRLGAGLGLRAVALASPTSLFLSFQEGDVPELHLARVEPGDLHLGRLVELEALVRAVEFGALEPEAALARLDALASAPASALWTVPAFALTAAASAVLFRMPTPDALAAGALGAGVGLLAVLARTRTALARLLEPLAAAGATASAGLLAHAGLATDPDVVALAALIVLVPGYGLTVALTELAHRHLASGTARLFGALGSFLGLGLGLALGRTLVERWLGAPPAAVAPAVPAWSAVPAVVAAALGFAVLFGVRGRHVAVVVAGAGLAYAGARLGTWTLGPELGAGLGALGLGVAANLLARATSLPASLPLVPGILLLVPGSVGFRSVAQFLRHEPLTGLETAVHVALVAMTLVGGLLGAHALSSPRRREPSRAAEPRLAALPEHALDHLVHATGLDHHAGGRRVVTPQGLEP